MIKYKITVKYILYGRNFGGKIIWRFSENMSFGGIYFGSWAGLSHNDIHNKMANRMRWEFNWAVDFFGSVRTKMQLKSGQIVVTLNLDCSRCVGPYSDRVSVLWIAFLALTEKPTPLPPPVYKTLWRSDVLIPSFQWWTPCRRLYWRI